MRQRMAAQHPDPASLRFVYPIEDRERFAQFWKAIYYDPDTAGLRPNLTFVRPDGSIVFETNAVGLSGDALDPRRKLAVIWGDSVVFCAGCGWSRLLDGYAPGYQFLNGGIDGDPYKNILRRAAEFNAKHRVALNILMLGWHPFVASWWEISHRRRRRSGVVNPGNAELRQELIRFLERNPNTVVLTVPTALNPGNLDKPMSAYCVEGDDAVVFRFFGDREREIAGQRDAYAYILERNAITREVCATRGIRVIDLFEAFDTSGAPDFREHFMDLLHFRVPAFPLVARLIYDGISDLLV
jgi:hypothetical protein